MKALFNILHTMFRKCNYREMSPGDFAVQYGGSFTAAPRTALALPEAVRYEADFPSATVINTKYGKEKKSRRFVGYQCVYFPSTRNAASIEASDRVSF